MISDCVQRVVVVLVVSRIAACNAAFNTCRSRCQGYSVNRYFAGVRPAFSVPLWRRSYTRTGQGNYQHNIVKRYVKLSRALQSDMVESGM